MGGHAHAAHDYTVRVGRIPRLLLFSLLSVSALATAFGLWQLWPSESAAPEIPASAAFAAPGVTFPHAEVVKVQPACPVTEGTSPDAEAEPSPSCGHLTVRVPESGSRERDVVVDLLPEVAASGLRPGDRVQLARLPAAAGQPATYSYFSTERHVPIFWLALAFAALVVAVARLRGLMALVALGFSGFMIVRFMLPALLAGESGTWIALVGASAIMFVVLYATHGPSLRTSAALAGTLVGLAVTAAVGVYAVSSTRLTGVADESGGLLSSFVQGLNFPGLLTCGLIVASLGVLNDVTITQSSAVWELRTLDPESPRFRIFSGAMRIGRDHIASTIYTIVFAYTGASIVVLLLLALYDQPVLELISSEDIAEEIVRTLASGIGLVLAVPVTTAIAAAVASPAHSRVSRGAHAADRD